MQDEWENEYEEAGYLEKRPNDFFAQFIDTIPARKLLLPNAGDGRNAVYAAQYGWGVDAFDPHKAYKEKAQQLADEKFVSINYETANLAEFSGKEDDYDLIALIHPALSNAERAKFFNKIIMYLKTGGRIILEAYAKDHSQNALSVVDANTVYEPSFLKEAFVELKTEMFEEKELNTEGGQSIKVIHYVGRKV